MRHHTQSTDSVRSEDEQKGGLRWGHKGGGEDKRERHHFLAEEECHKSIELISLRNQV